MESLQILEILERLSESFKAAPQKLALKSKSFEISYRELDKISDRYAELLLARDIGNTFYYLGRPDLLLHIYFLACLKSGKAFLAINRSLTPKNVHSIVIELGGPPVVFTDGQTDIGSYFGLKFELLPEITNEDASINTPFIVARSDCRPIGYNTTSGSTGIPKVIPWTLEDLQQNLRLTEHAWDIGSNDIIGNPGEFSAEHLLVTLVRGATMSFSSISQQSAQATRDWLTNDKVSVLICYIAIFRAFHYIEGQFKYLRAIGTYGDVSLASDLELFNRMCRPGAEYHSFLALQEIAYLTRATYRQGETSTNFQLPLGKPVLDGSILLVDEDGLPIQPGEIGEIVIKEPSLTVFKDGYVGGRKGSGHLLIKQGVEVGFAIGDLASIDEDGCLNFAGRLDDQVKISGFNVRLIEIEQAAIKVDGVSEVAVTVHGGKRENRILCCHYVGDIEFLVLRNVMATMLPMFMVPHHFNKITELPKTSTGKIDKTKLRFVIDHEQEGFDGSSGGVVDELKMLWSRLLGHSAFDLDSKFTDVGGDSLALIKMCLWIEERYGQKIEFERFNRAGMSISGLVKMIEQTQSAPRELFQKPEKKLSSDSLQTTSQPNAENLLLLNSMILDRWEATRVGQSKYFRCEHHGHDGIPIVWIFQTEAEYHSLTNALGSDYCLYGARSMSEAKGFFENGPQDDMQYYTEDNVSTLTAAYIAEILELTKGKPFILGGNCQAGLISLNMAEKLMQTNVEIHRLIILNMIEDRQDYALPTTLLFGASEFDDYNMLPKGAKAFADKTTNIIKGTHGQYFRPEFVGEIVNAIKMSNFHHPKNNVNIGRPKRI